MKSKNLYFEGASTIPLRWLLISLTLVTLYFQPTLADPFNSPKLWLLMIFASWIAGYIIGFKHIIFSTLVFRRLVSLVTVLTIFLLISTLFTDNLYVAFLGETQRRNGFLQYFALSILMIASAMFFRSANIKKLFQVTYLIAFISAFYALLQTTDNDFVNWSNPYNSIIGTVGNPNFAAALMAVMGIIIFSSMFTSGQKILVKLTLASLAFSLLFLIYRSNALQGLLAYGLGVGIFLTVILWSRNKVLGLSATFTGALIVLISVMGILQIGPLERYLYKPSVSLRGHYWGTGFEMWLSQPLFGIGVDRYGAYFREFRDPSYPLTYGFEITSTNAHNTFIQFFATSGVFVGLAYILLNLYILQRAIKGIKVFDSDRKVYLTGLLSAWVGFHAQSLVSIDNIGVSIWGWILGGAIVGLSVSHIDEIEKVYTPAKSSIRSSNLLQSLTSSTLVLLTLVFVSTLYSGESNSYKSSVQVNLQDVNSREFYKELQVKVINSHLIDPAYTLFSASNLIESGFVNEGIVAIENVSLNDPRNINALNYLAIVYEKLGDLPKSITYREKIVSLDPWGATNYLALGKSYKQLGNSSKSQEMLDKILSFASSNPIAELAVKELQP